jgi:hypothetical protein
MLSILRVFVFGHHVLFYYTTPHARYIGRKCTGYRTLGSQIVMIIVLITRTMFYAWQSYSRVFDQG